MFDFDPSKHLTSPDENSAAMKGQSFTKSKVFNFETYTPASLEDERLRYSIQLEKQQELQQVTRFQNQLPCMPPLISSRLSTLPVKISSKVSPSSTSSAFSISELMRKDDGPNSQVTLFKEQSIQNNEGRQPVLLFQPPSQPPNLIKATSLSDENRPAQSLLLIPASQSSNGRSILNTFFHQPLLPRENSWNSLGLSVTTSSVTSTKVSSVARIRFDDTKTEVSSDSVAKTESMAPLPGSPLKKSILKRQSNDSMERYLTVFGYLSISFFLKIKCFIKGFNLNHYYFLPICRVLEQVDFENHFQRLPQFCPTTEIPQLIAVPTTSQSQPMQSMQDESTKQQQQLADIPKSVLDNSDGNLGVTSNRQILDKRRNLVMQLFDQHGYYPSDNITASFQQLHKDLFPSRWNLQVKIREVRQNIMKKQRFVILLCLHILNTL